ncbi:MAG: ATP-binding protein [Prolixibacteraceae bacterium]|nr:ATP-binding protein [Prolixibacteraceae bacterium]
MIRRKLFEDLQGHLLKKEYSIITGARQTGKSTLLKQLEVYCKKMEIPVVFLNLENKTILAELNENPLNLLKFIPEPNRKTVALMDEIQYLDDPSNFLKLLYDEHSAQIKVVATGSSAFYIDNQFRDSLAGRKKIFQLYTCSFDEYLALSGKSELREEKDHLLKNRDFKSTLIDYLRVEWESYMLYGGYPAIVTEPDKQEKMNRLREIRDSFVKRDILESGVINETAFYNLFRILAGQTGSIVNVNELSSTLRIKNETVDNFLTIMQKCFHIALIKPFFRNLRKELIKMPKVFLLDTGLRNCLLNNFQPMAVRTDKGELWENTVFRIFADKIGIDSIQYWRTSGGNEVDFVLSDIDRIKAIEVKYDNNQVKLNKYKLFAEAYPEISLQFFWLNPFDQEFFRRIYLNP